MSLIRSRPVDILLYLPGFLTKSAEYKAGLDAESGEHERMRIALLDIEKQFNVKTAEWGLDKWEELLGIATDKTKSIKERRIAVQEKLTKPGSVTVEFLKKLIDAYLEAGESNITEYPAGYAVKITFPGNGTWQIRNIEKAVREYIPAHLGWRYKALVPVKLLLHFGFRAKIKKTIRIYPASSADWTITASAYVGVATEFSRNWIIGGD